MRKAQDGREANSWQQPTLFLLVNSSCMKEKTLTISWKWTSAGILKNCGRIGAYVGMYFLEVADYYTRENNDEKEMLKLLYQSLRALEHPAIPKRLVQYVFEIKSLVVNGEYPGAPKDVTLQESTVYALQFIAATPVEKLYTFTVKEDILKELGMVAQEYRSRFMDRQFKSLQILETLY